MIADEAKAQLRRLMELREAHDEAKTAEKNAKAEYDEAEADVYEALEEGGVKGALKVDLGEPWGTVAFASRKTYYARILDEDAAVEHYKQRGEKKAVTSPKIVKARVNETVREVMESGHGNLPPGVDYYTDRGVTITRQKS